MQRRMVHNRQVHTSYSIVNFAKAGFASWVVLRFECLFLPVVYKPVMGLLVDEMVAVLWQ
jgi:hypothetical protein